MVHRRSCCYHQAEPLCNADEEDGEVYDKSGLRAQTQVLLSVTSRAAGGVDGLASVRRGGEGDKKGVSMAFFELHFSPERDFSHTHLLKG